MPTRRSLLRTAALLPVTAALLPALGLTARQATAAEGKGTGHGAKQADFLFVQNARGVSMQDGRLQLTRVNPVTIMFSDRPERVAGHVATRRFVALWTEGPDSFAADPPNATLSFLADRDLEDVVVVLREPRLEGETLSYQVEVLEGRLPERAGEASLFIDIIGMPLTPISYAGAARRGYRRAVIW